MFESCIYITNYNQNGVVTSEGFTNIHLQPADFKAPMQNGFIIVQYVLNFEFNSTNGWGLGC